MAAQEDLAQLTGHVIVCGLHGVGLRVVEQLHVTGVDVVVVDDGGDERLSRTVQEWGLAYLVGNSRLGSMLLAAGVERAAAVICVEEDDLATLETALLARDLAPGVRIVVQMANPAVARAVEAVTGSGSVLDVADLAAPAIVDACLQHRTETFVLGGEEFVTLEASAQRSTSLRELYGDLVPLAVVPADGSAVAVCPGRDLAVAAGDRVIVLGSAAEMAAGPGGVALGEARLTPGRRRHSTWMGAPARLARSVYDVSDRPLRVATAALVVLVAVSTIVIRLGYEVRPGDHPIRWIDSAYFTIETVATVGFGDFSFEHQSTWLEIYGILLIAFGVALVTTAYALLTNLLVSRRIEASLGVRRVGSMEDHVVLIGLGGIGVRVLEGLRREGRNVVVVERDPANRHLAQARAVDAHVLVADATLRATLDAANVSRAAAVAVLTSDDLTNIDCGLTVRDYLRSAGQDIPVVMRIFDRPLGRIIEDSFGFRHVRSTSSLAAPWFVGAALGLDVLSTFYVEQEPLLVARLTVVPGGGLAGLAIRDLSARIRVVAIRRAAQPSGSRLEHPPRRDTRFAAGDEAYLVGTYEELLVLLRRDAPGRPHPTA